MIAHEASATLSPSAGHLVITPQESRSDVAGRLVVRLMSAELFLVVLTQMVAVPVGSGEDTQISLAFLIHFSVLGYLMMKGILVIEPRRLLLYLGMVSTAVLFHARLKSPDYSPTSLLLFCAIYSTYIFAIPIERKNYLSIVKFFILVATCAGCLTWFDWLTQIVGFGKIDVYHQLPRVFQYRDYNYMKRFWFGPIRIQPNGLFFLESSHLSQFIAMGLVFEIAFFMRVKRMLFLAISLLGTFGGTGFSILLLTAPFLLPRLRGPLLLAGVVGIPIAFLLALQMGLVDNVVRRASEFDKTGASGNIRFVLPLRAVADAVSGPVDDLLLGKGSGTMPRGTDAVHAFAWAPYAKVTVEYGIICGVFWLLLTWFGMFRHGIPFAASWALFIQYHLMNGALAVPLHTVYCFILAGGYLIIEKNSKTNDTIPIDDGELATIRQMSR